MNCARIVSFMRRLCCLAPAVPLLLASQSNAQYCGAGSNRCDAGIPRISRVTFGAIDNPQGVGVGPFGCYSDYTAQSTVVFKGSTYLITLYDPNTSPFTGNQAAVWIDWNQDFTFGPGEQTNLVSFDGSFTWVANITVPAGALAGNTRMRVRYMNSGTLSPCDNTALGEVEDYTVTVTDTTSGACCAPNGGCAVVNSSDCFGIYQGGGVSCIPNNPCGGACCTTSGACTMVHMAEGCAAPNIFQAHSTCTTIVCFGTCCDLGTGVCTPSGSGAPGCPCGTAWQGIGSTCTPSPCTQGACCVNTTGACTLTPLPGCAAGSTFRGAGTTCAPSPCGGVCCNTATGACTLALSAASCGTGTAYQAGSVCSANPCLGQACCNSTTGACTFSGTTACAAGAVSLGTGTICLPFPCTTGACCNNTTGACTTGGTACASGLTYRGAGTVCTPTPCSLGACCNNNSGACTTATSSANCAAGTTFRGVGTVCSPTPCVTGACCDANTGTCTTTTSSGCALVFQGNGTVCSPSPCGGGACCNSTTGVCTLMTVTACPGATSVFLGAGVSCTNPNPCTQPIVGACCATSGACTVATSAACTTPSSYLGDSIACYNSPGSPCGTGACCRSDGTCTITDSISCFGTAGTYLGFGITCASLGSHCYAEVEFNDTRPGATVPPGMLADGDTVVGHTTGSSTAAGIASVDYFSIQPMPRTGGSGIYRHTLTITSAGEPADGVAGHSLISRGLSQIDSVTDYRNALVTEDASVQTTSNSAVVGTPARTLVWYGFGHSERFDFQARYSGTPAASPYRVTMNTTDVSPSNLGTFAAGLLTVSTIGQGHTTNTSFWVFDSTFTPIPGFGNDDAPNALDHGTLQSQATHELLAPGDYYIAISNSIVTVGIPSAPPPFERSPNNAVSTPGTVLCTTSTVLTAPNLAFALTDGNGATSQFAIAKVNGFDVVWAKFTLAAPSAGACCTPSGACRIVAQYECTSNLVLNGVTMGGLSGTYQGNGVTCSSVSCTQPPTGACCQLDGTCTFASSFACTSYTGAWKGAGSLCSQQPCPGSISGGGVPLDTNTSGAQQGGVFVNVIAGNDPILIKRIDYYCVQAYNNAPLTNTGARSAPMQAIFYARQGLGSYLGLEGGVGNPGGCTPPPNSDWTVNTDTGAVLSTPGNWQTTAVNLSTPLSVPALQTRALYLTSNLGGFGYRLDGITDYMGADGVMMHSDEGRTMASGLNTNGNPGWDRTLLPTTATFNGRIFYAFTGACCSGVGACTITTAGACPPGSNFVGLSVACAPNPCAGVCCRGSTCNSTVGLASCTASGLAGARFVPMVASCNAPANTAVPCCYADYNKISGITVQDIFDFLSDWFASSPFTNTGSNGDPGALSVQNIFDFLNAWFAGGC